MEAKAQKLNGSRWSRKYNHEKHILATLTFDDYFVTNSLQRTPNVLLQECILWISKLDAF